MSLRNTTIKVIPNETTLEQENSTCILVDSTAEKISKLWVYCFILLGSFLGNSFIIIIVYKNRHLRKTINYFIVNMAVSDLFSPLMLLPVQITELSTDSRHWRVSGILGSFFCKFYYFASLLSLLVCSQCLVWIAIDRFVAIVFPIKLGLISPKIRTIAIISTWTFAGLFNFPSLITPRLVQRGKDTVCTDGNTEIVRINREVIGEAYGWLQLTFLFIAPLFIITIMYTAIALVLKRQNKTLADNTPQAQPHSWKKRRKAILMAIVVVVLFYICVIPQTLLHFFYYWRPSCPFHRVIYFLAQISIYLSSTVNPIVCLSLVESYRQGLRNIVCACKVKREYITLKGIEKRSKKNCQQNCKRRENVQEKLDTVL